MWSGGRLADPLPKDAAYYSTNDAYPIIRLWIDPRRLSSMELERAVLVAQEAHAVRGQGLCRCRGVLNC
jgi:hypothetical protein